MAPGTGRGHPLGLVLKAGAWYLVAAKDDQPRTCRVSSIEDARPLPDTFTRPAGFTLAAYWRDQVERYERADDTATIRLSPRGVAALPDVLGPRAAALATDTLATPDETGWHTATIPLGSVAHATTGLLRLGPDARRPSRTWSPT
ncbi:WYL domain-containing protein [Saccharothrix sp. NPDC042600]|uniref:WYL domain-containing protein n=1 Tax=Saccharothrix TaxID=2071 RepID=UPI0033E11D6C|nr:hypothetical protein GCM10017745_77290 [Saccharothrix mutabilis subsp. capreolus]